MAFVRTLLAWLVAAATVLTVVELGLRVVGLGPKDSPVTYDSDIGWVNRRSAHGLLAGREFTAHWRTDSRGLRITPRATDTPAPSVVLLGDSFVFGTSVGEHDTIPARLQSSWDAAGVHLVAQNAGVLGYDTGQAVRWFELHGAELAPRAVVLCVYENDLFWNTQDMYASNDGPRAKVRLSEDALRDAPVGPAVSTPLWRRSAIGHVLAPLIAPTAVPKIEVDGGTLFAELAPLVPVLEPTLDRAMDDAGRLALTRLRLATNAVGAELLVVTIPSAPLLESNWRAVYERRGLASVAGWSPELPIERWQRLCDDTGVEYLDATRALTAHRSQHLDERLYWRDDWHLDPTGNDVVARAIDAYLTGRIAIGERGPRRAATWTAPSTWLPRVALWLAATMLVALILSRQSGSRGFALDALGAGLMIATVMALVIGGGAALALLPPPWSQLVMAAVVVTVATVALYHLRDRFGTIAELIGTFARRGHWQLMPTLVVLIGLGSLLIVAASSPFVAPFVYTLF